MTNIATAKRAGSASSGEEPEAKKTRCAANVTPDENKTNQKNHVHGSPLEFDPNADDAVDLIACHFALTRDLAEGAVRLAKTLKVDDPGIFVTFRSGDTIRVHLQRNENGRPCDPGNNGDEALGNLKEWVTNAVPQEKQEFIFSSGAFGMGIGNLSQREYNHTYGILACTKAQQRTPWVVDMFNGYHSLGGVLVVTGTGVGQATMSKGNSSLFID